MALQMMMLSINHNEMQWKHKLLLLIQESLKIINTNNGYYYFTDQLKHDNSRTVKFPLTINSYPYSNGVQNSLRISLDGHYQIIYTDFYQKSGQFVTHDEWK